MLDVARDLVEDRPWAEVSIAEVTKRAGLTRTAFYKHFPDRRALLMALFEELSTDLAAAPDAWQRGEDGDPAELLTEAVGALVATFHSHGRLLSAIAGEAAHDRELADVYARFGERLAVGVAARIQRDVAAGVSTVEDPAEVAAALVWMNERYLQARFGRRPLADPGRCTAALVEVWVRAIYDR
jgi:AcrR family transcriptional regulator